MNGINSLLDNYGTTIDLDNANHLRQGSDTDLTAFLDELNKGEVAAVFVNNSNPVYTLPNGAAFAEALTKKVELSVSFSDRPDETSAVCNYVSPDHHAFESWCDAEPRTGIYSVLLYFLPVRQRRAYSYGQATRRTSTITWRPIGRLLFSAKLPEAGIKYCRMGFLNCPLQ